MDVKFDEQLTDGCFDKQTDRLMTGWIDQWIDW